MKNPIIGLQSTSVIKTSSQVRMRNSGFSYKCHGQSTLSIRCR